MKIKCLYAEQEALDKIIKPMFTILYDKFFPNTTSLSESYKEISNKTNIPTSSVRNHFNCRLPQFSDISSCPDALEFLEYLKLFDDTCLNTYIDKLNSKEKLHKILKDSRKSKKFSSRNVESSTGISHTCVLKNEKSSIPSASTFLVYCGLYELPIKNEILRVIKE